MHGLPTPSLTENKELALIFLNHKLYEDGSFNVLKSKMSVSKLYLFISYAHTLYKALVTILNNKDFHPENNILSEVDFKTIEKINFTI